MADPISATLVAAGVSASTAASVGAAAATAGSVISAVGTVGGVVASLAGAGMRVAGAQQQVLGAQDQARAFAFQAQQERLRAQQAELQARGALLTGRSDAVRVRDALLRTLAAQNARYAGAGLALDEGTPATVADDSREQAEIELGIIGDNAQIAAADRRMQAASFNLNATEYDRRGRDVMRSAGGNLHLSIFDVADRLVQRLPGTTTSNSTSNRVRRDDFSGASLNQGNF
jgi:hypothetical protein